MQGKMQGAVERETREGGVGTGARGATSQSRQNWTYRRALRDRSEAVREVRRSALILILTTILIKVSFNYSYFNLKWYLI